MGEHNTIIMNARKKDTILRGFLCCSTTMITRVHAFLLCGNVWVLTPGEGLEEDSGRFR